VIQTPTLWKKKKKIRKSEGESIRSGEKGELIPLKKKKRGGRSKDYRRTDIEAESTFEKGRRKKPETAVEK